LTNDAKSAPTKRTNFIAPSAKMETVENRTSKLDSK